MALFKVSQGPSSNLNAQALTEGFCWFTPDDGKFYIDAKKNNTLTRIPLNAAYADASGEVHSHNIVPMISKTYTDIIGTANNQAGASFYFGKIRPNNWYEIWRIRYRVRVYVPGQNGYDQKADVLITGSSSSVRSYWSFNTIGASSAAYYHNLYRLKSTGYNAGYSHQLGIGLRSSTNPTNISYKRTFEIEILETENCTFEFYDTCKAQNSTAIPELAGANNYDGVSEINFITNGLQETSDADSIEDRQTYFCAKTSTDKGIWAYSLFMEDGNGTYQGICTTSTGTIASDRTTATTKLANTAGFKVGGTIYYSNTNYNANANITGWGVIYNQTTVFDARYSFNVTLSNANPAVTLTAYKPVYLVGTIHDDGLYYLDSTWWTQTPTDTSKIYVLVGGCYDQSNDYCRIVLYQHNPWYYYDGTRLQPYIDSLYVKQTSGVTNVAYDTTNKKITKTINGTTSDVVTISKIKTDLALSKSDIGLGNVTNTTALNNSTGAKGDIIYWSAANTPAHLTVESSTTKKFLTVTSQVPSWVAISKSDVGLSNVTNHAQVTAITWSDNKLKQSISGNTATDIVSIGEIKSALALTKSDVGLGNVPNVDATNASNITSGTLAAARLATSGVTAGSYGPSANDSPAHGAGFSVPYFTVDNKGRVTAASTKTITLPPDTNNKVTQTNITATTSADYRILLSASTNDTTETNTSNKNTNLRFNTGTKTLSVGGNITATGDLTLTGDAYLNSQTYADGVTTGSLLVNGNATFTNVPTSVTPAASSNDNSIATTAFVKTSVAGLSGAMHFRGITTVAMSDGSTIDPQITGYDFTNNKQPGDVIIDSAMSYEYVWTGAKWERLGPDGSYKVVQSAVTAPTAVTNKWVSSIGQDANGVISASYSTLDTSGAWAGTASNVTGIVAIANGGTGASTAGAARTNLGLGSFATRNSLAWNEITQSGANSIEEGTSDFTDNTEIFSSYASNNGFADSAATGKVYRRDAIHMYNYIKNKASGTWAISISGNAATATSATSATTAANLANKPSLAASDNDITVTAGGKTSDAFTVPYASNAGKTNKTLTLANGRSFNGSADVTLLTNDLTPAIHKTYASTNYYATTANSYEAATWYFMSVKPDSWYKPWTVHFKVHSFCPGYASYESYSDCMISGRSNSFVYHNWNERQDTAHYYTTIYPLTSTGFNNGYGHAIGISIIYGSNYTTAAYYRTFEVDYYDCENCTITLLDTPVKWASWTGTGSTNYGSLSNMDAVSRGLQESGDANSFDRVIMYYNYNKVSSTFRLPGYSLFGYDRNNAMQSFSLYNDGYTGTTTSINTTRVYNTAGIDWTKGIYYNNSSSNFATNANFTNHVYQTISGIDFRYSDNCVPASSATTLGMVLYKAVYLRGVIKEDGLFYLAPMNVTYNSATYKRAWIQDIPTAVETDGTYQYVYWFVGYPYYNSSYANSLYQLNLFQENKMYWFHNGRFEEYAAPVVSAEIATTAISANYVNLYEARATTTTLNKAANYVGAGKMFHLIASSSTSATDNGKPPMGDANIFQMNWDNNGGYDAQIAISTAANRMEFRDQPSTKKAWREVVTSTPGTAAGGITQPVYISTTGVATAISYTIAKSVPSDAVFTDTLNTAGSTDTSSKIFLVGATSQASSAQTYSDNQVYATNGQLDANKVRIAEAVSLVYNSTTQALDFIFS